MRNKLFVVVSLLIMASMVLAACDPASSHPRESGRDREVVKTVDGREEGQTVVVTATPRSPGQGMEVEGSDHLHVGYLWRS